MSVALSHSPRQDAVVRVVLSNCTAGNTTVVPSMAVFSAGSSVRTSFPFTIFAADDQVDFGSGYTCSLGFSVETSDPRFGRGPALTVPVAIVDNDVAGCTSVMNATEVLEGGAVQVRVSVQSRPLADVNITVDFAEAVAAGVDGTVLRAPSVVVTNGVIVRGGNSPAVLFTVSPANWSALRTVSLSFGNDDVAGPSRRRFSMSTTVSSTESMYKSIGVCDGSSSGLASFDVLEDDRAGVLIKPQSLLVSEDQSSAQANASYTIKLLSQPMSSVVVSLRDFSSPAQVVVTPSTITIPADGWNTSYAVLVQGIADDVTETPQQTTYIGHALTSLDASYTIGNLTGVVTALPESNIVSVVVLDFKKGVVEVVDTTPAPQLVTAVISDVANEVTVTFDRGTNTPVSATASGVGVAAPCKTTGVFSAATLWQLDGATTSGSTTLAPSTCTWSSNTTLVVALDAGAPALASWAGEVSISLRGGNIRANNASIMFSSGSVVATPRAQPPALVGAQLSDSGASVLLRFDRAGAGVVGANRTSGTGPCSLILGNTNLGLGAVCSWQTPTTLSLAFGFAAADSGTAASTGADPPGMLLPMMPFVVDADCVAGRSVRLLLGAVAAVPRGVLTSQGCVNVAPANNPPVPTARIVGSTRLGLCTPLLLDASGSSGGGGRAMTFQWSLVGLNEDGVSSVSAILQVGADSGMNGFRFSVSNSTLLLPNAVFNVSVAVQNFMGASSTANATVEIAGQPLPDIRVESELNPRVYVRQSVSMKVRGSVSSCASSGDGRALQWLWFLRTIGAPAGTVEAGYVTRWSSEGPRAGFTATGEWLLSTSVALSEYVTSDPTTLRIPANVLQPGLEYLVEVVGRMAQRPSVNVRKHVIANVPLPSRSRQWSGRHRIAIDLNLVCMSVQNSGLVRVSTLLEGVQAIISDGNRE